MKNWKIILITIGIIVALVLMFMFAFNGVQNKAISLEEQIATAQSNISVQQKRRADLIPNLVDCVKAYDEHEYNTILKVVEARSINNDNIAENVTTMINAVAEKYPELKSNENYKELMNELAITENLIADYRGNYNTWVKAYKSYIRKWPNTSILSMMGYEPAVFEYLTYNASEDAPTNLFGD